MLRRLLTDNHEDRRREQRRLARRALRLARSLVAPASLTRLDEPDAFGRRYVLTVDLPTTSRSTSRSRTSRWPPSTCSTPRPRRTPLDVVSVVEAVLEPPRQVLLAQQHEARGRGDRGDEGRRDRVRRADGAARGRHLAAAAGRAARGDVRDLPPDPPVAARGRLEPKSVVREMCEQGMGFTDFVARYQLARSEGLVLRYLTDAYRTLRQTVPEEHRTPELDDLVEWLGETVRQTDSSLLDEWEALTDPDARPGRRGRATRRRHRRGRCRAAGAGVPGDGPQRDVAPGRAARPATTSTAWPPSSGRTRSCADPPRGGRDDARGLGRGARGVLRRARRRSASTRTPAAPRCSSIETRGPGLAACARSSTTRRATTTG